MSPAASALSSEDTQPSPVVDLPVSGTQWRTARRDVGAAMVLRAALSGLAAVALLVAAVLLFRHGVRDDAFPPVIPGTKATTVTRYSAPWIAAAGGALLLAGLLNIRVVVDLLERRGLAGSPAPDSQ